MMRVRRRMRIRRTYVKAALHTMLQPALETVPGVLHIAEILVLASELEPSGVVARLGGTLEIPERVPGIVGDELRVDAGGGTGRTHVDGLCGVGRDGPRRELGGDLENDGDGDIDQLLELGIVDLGRTDCGIGRGWTGARVQLLCTIDEGENVSAPCDPASGICVGWLDGGLLDGEDGESGKGRSEGRGPVACTGGSREGRGGARSDVEASKGAGKRFLVSVCGRRCVWRGECGHVGMRLRRRRGPGRPI